MHWTGTSLDPVSGPGLPLISLRATEERAELIPGRWCPLRPALRALVASCWD